MDLNIIRFPRGDSQVLLFERWNADETEALSLADWTLFLYFKRKLTDTDEEAALRVVNGPADHEPPDSDGIVFRSRLRVTAEQSRQLSGRYHASLKYVDPLSGEEKTTMEFVAEFAPTATQTATVES